MIPCPICTPFPCPVPVPVMSLLPLCFCCCHFEGCRVGFVPLKSCAVGSSGAWQQRGVYFCWVIFSLMLLALLLMLAATLQCNGVEPCNTASRCLWAPSSGTQTAHFVESKLDLASLLFHHLVSSLPSAQDAGLWLSCRVSMSALSMLYNLSPSTSYQPEPLC